MIPACSLVLLCLSVMSTFLLVFEGAVQRKSQADSVLWSSASCGLFLYSPLGGIPLSVCFLSCDGDVVSALLLSVCCLRWSDADAEVRVSSAWSLELSKAASLNEGSSRSTSCQGCGLVSVSSVHSASCMFSPSSSRVNGDGCHGWAVSHFCHSVLVHCVSPDSETFVVDMAWNIKHLNALLAFGDIKMYLLSLNVKIIIKQKRFRYAGG